ncbi:MAG: HipA domain-containing protein [Clostridia bacterium]|nr:HipA domain-containing protein [Clostridia bacterium]
MRCLCCGKEFSTAATPYELSCGWHSSCVKKFFGTKKLPDIDVSDSVLEQLATESTAKGYTVPGVQKKLSLHLSEDSEPRLTLVNYPTGYILKPQTKEYTALPEAEYLVMQMAVATKIKTVPFALLQIGSSKREFAYITRRIDRVKIGKATKMLAMEDFCQLEDRLTADKYKGSYERCAKVVEAYSESRGLDMADLFLCIVFSYAVGNSDMHLKNFSLIETECGSGRYHLSDAYDMLPVNVIMPADTEELALTLNGKKSNIRRNDFLTFAENAGLDRKQAEKMIAKIVSMRDTYLELCRESYLPEDMKTAFEELICKRIENLG